MSSAAIDASALIAFLREEPGCDVAARHLRRSCISAVNLSEVLEKRCREDESPQRLLAMLRNWQIEVVPFDADHAELSAALKKRLGKSNVSLADRACLVLASSRGIPAVTSDREWGTLPVGAEVICIRGVLH